LRTREQTSPGRQGPILKTHEALYAGARVDTIMAYGVRFGFKLNPYGKCRPHTVQSM
jgi:hypothetical protein